MTVNILLVNIKNPQTDNPRAFLFVSKEMRFNKKKNQLNKRDKVYIYDR